MPPPLDFWSTVSFTHAHTSVRHTDSRASLFVSILMPPPLDFWSTVSFTHAHTSVRHTDSRASLFVSILMPPPLDFWGTVRVTHVRASVCHTFNFSSITKVLLKQIIWNLYARLGAIKEEGVYNVVISCAKSLIL
jgi:hypothetical protein